MQTALHELGHGSHFRRAGQGYWIDFVAATLFPTGNCGGYGCSTGTNDGNVAIGESWAEFIGTNHALRFHANGLKRSNWAAQQFGTVNGMPNQPLFPQGFIRYDIALEREPWFFNDWIASGIYNDIDIVNTWPLEDGWDRTTPWFVSPRTSIKIHHTNLSKN